MEPDDRDDRWPALVQAQWGQTQTTLHLWTQIVGKIRLQLEPMLNHWWNVTLYVTPRGLTTSSMPYPGGRALQIDFDFIAQELVLADCDGGRTAFALEPMTVAEFYRRVMEAVRSLGFDVRIVAKPNEVADAIPFARDTVHSVYDGRQAYRFWRALVQADRLCKIFRAPFLGKASPVHFFWGSFDLAVTRFSGRTAPPHPGGFPNMPDSAMREAYSHEEQSVGFWAGGGGSEALFYSYAYPTPAGFSETAIEPAAASWYAPMGEFVLPYEAARTAPDPDRSVLAFFQSTYDAAANLARWDRAALERATTLDHRGGTNAS